MVQPYPIYLYTDFDETMTEANTPLIFIKKLLSGRKSIVLLEIMKALLKEKKVNGASFMQSIKRVPKRQLGDIAEVIAQVIKIKRKWRLELQKLIRDNPDCYEIELIILTRNFKIIPELFMAHVGEGLVKYLSQGKFNGKVSYKGNSLTGSSYEAKVNGKLVDISKTNKYISEVIDKVPFIESKHIISGHAYYFGDDEDYDILSKVKKLKGLHFVRI